MKELFVEEKKYQVRYTDFQQKIDIIDIKYESLTNNVWFAHGQVIYTETNFVRVGEEWAKPKKIMTSSNYEFSKKGFEYQ